MTGCSLCFMSRKLLSIPVFKFVVRYTSGILRLSQWKISANCQFFMTDLLFSNRLVIVGSKFMGSASYSGSAVGWIEELARLLNLYI